MNRPWKIWLVFGLCLGVAVLAMAWVTRTAARLERAEWQAAQRAEVEERARLALWRMDSLLAPLLVEENARPFEAYEAFPAAPLAYTKSYTQFKSGDVVVPSPLLTFSSSNILLHFQFTPGGQLTSPQVPQGNQRDLAEASYTTPDRIQTAAARLNALQSLLVANNPDPTGTPAIGSARSARVDLGQRLLQEAGADPPAPVGRPPDEAAPQIASGPAPQRSQVFRNTAERQARQKFSDYSQQQAIANNRLLTPTPEPARTSQPGPLRAPLFRPVWLGSALVLARRVDLGAGPVVQGCWLDWDHLRHALRDAVLDLFPEAELVPVTVPNGGGDARALASIPARLTFGPAATLSPPAWTPVRLSLVLAWVGMAFAGAAVAGLLYGTIALSERRADFVSAVTHELRTPLTTFRMYSEMLATNMVSDPAKRTRYLQTLRAEADRLSHLVENVLAYARLERGRAQRHVEVVTLAALLQRVSPRLTERADAAGLQLRTGCAADVQAVSLAVDVSAVEQILFNLVDNAGKYAAPHASDKTLHLDIQAETRWVFVRVRDHGPGVAAETVRRLFQPFSKSAQEAARTAPGVGLGLALCRRLSRELGGDLLFDATVRDGAGFILRLPRRESGASPTHGSD